MTTCATMTQRPRRQPHATSRAPSSQVQEAIRHAIHTEIAMKRLILVARLATVFTGCETCEVCEGCETGEAQPPSPRLTAIWTDLCTLSVEVLDGEGPYLLGIANTGPEDNGWYGEACNDAGFCHPLETALTLPSIHQSCDGAGIDAVEAGVNTLLTEFFHEETTYALFDTDMTLLDCFGDNCRYYDPDASWVLSGN